MQNQYIKKSKSIRANKEIGIITFLVAILGYVIYVMTASLVNINSDYSEMIFLLSWLGIFLGLYVVVTWYKLTRTVFSLYTIFMLFFFLFTFGQCFMWAFGIHIPSEISQQVALFPGFGVPSGGDIVKAQGLTLICILMFHSGAVICYKPRTKPRIKAKVSQQDAVKIDDSITLKSIYYACLIASLVVVPITLYYVYTDFQLSSVYGYSALYSSEFVVKGATVSGLLSKMFFPCLVGLLIGSGYNKKVQMNVYIAFAIYLLINLLAGDRSSWIYKIVILVWLSHTCYKPINFKRLAKYAVIAIVGLYITHAIVSFRDVGLSNITVASVFDSLSFKDSPIISGIFEMGSTMNLTIVLQKYGWDVWPYANTYLLAILGMVTNGVIYALGIPFALLSDWYSQSYLGISWGAGFSIIAEAVINVGPIIAPLIMIVLGYIITSMIYLDKEMSYKERPFRFFFAAATLHNFITIIRNESHVLLKDWFYGVVCLCIFILVIRKCCFGAHGEYKTRLGEKG